MVAAKHPPTTITSDKGSKNSMINIPAGSKKPRKPL